MAKETQKFQAEVKELLGLMIHSLYSHRDVFLRELISNSSDALDKLRFEEASNANWDLSKEERHVRLEADPENKTLTIKDNGIGMTKDEIVNNIGTIARSGTKEFLKKALEGNTQPDLIGQFGVGFYSSFMVADKVTVHTQKAGTTDGVVWESAGDGEFSLEDKVRSESHGTTITLHLKEFPEDTEQQDFTAEWTLRSIVKKYSDFIEYPIKMLVSREEPELDKDDKPIEGQTKKVEEDAVLNSMKALWLKKSADIKEEEYQEFYKHLTSDWSNPLETIHYKAEGTQEFSSLMYIPSQAPFDYNYRDSKVGLSLYVKRVFIAADCDDLIPVYMRFMKGIVDSNDLPLNVSREILQKDRQIVSIRKAIVSKILKTLSNMLNKDREKYESFWKVFGATFKEGIPSDISNKDKVTDLCLFSTSASDKLTTLKEYVARMKPEQKAIYYITGETITQLADSPYLEKLRKKGYEVIYLTDHVDEWVMQSLPKYDEKEVVSITAENLELDTEEEKEKAKEELKSKEEKYKSLTDVILKSLEENIKEVKVSDRLVDSPVCLVSGSGDQSAHMERMMEAMGQAIPKSKRILEINPDHKVFEIMAGKSDDQQKVWAEILYNQALLNEGSQIENPTKFGQQIAQLMVDANL
ncbi:MAG: molecular chaperone HtpG [Zetaproteobacteria bacterium]|nr:molecular chaperone HtpG [Pseudobdellovibrionaceae bacterium]